MMNTLGAASVGSAWIPDLLFNLFQLVFAAYLTAKAPLIVGLLLRLSWVAPWKGARLGLLAFSSSYGVQSCTILSHAGYCSN